MICDGCRLDVICRFYSDILGTTLNADVFEVRCKYKEMEREECGLDNSVFSTASVDGNVLATSACGRCCGESDCVDSGEGVGTSEEVEITDELLEQFDGFNERCKYLWGIGKTPKEVSQILGISVTRIYSKYKAYKADVLKAFKTETGDGTFKTVHDISVEFGVPESKVDGILKKEGLI